MRIKNIANNRDMSGYFYSSHHYHPSTNHLQIEPWLGGYQLRLDEEVELPDSLYTSARKMLDDLKEHRIIHFEAPISKVETIEEVVAPVKREKITAMEISIPEETPETVVESKEEVITEDTAPEVVEEAPVSLKTPWNKKGKKK